MCKNSNPTSIQNLVRVGKDTLELLGGAQGLTPLAHAGSTVLRLAAAQVHLLLDPRTQKTAVARLTALYRLAPMLDRVLPVWITARIGPLGHGRPHALDENAFAREAVVHAVLLLEMLGRLSRKPASIDRNFQTIDRIASDFLTLRFRAQGGNKKMRLSPEPVTASTIKTWLRKYEADPVYGLYDKPRCQRNSGTHHHVKRSYAVPTKPVSKTTIGRQQPSKVVPLHTGGGGRHPITVPPRRLN
jgi:hypothetical protein